MPAECTTCGKDIGTWRRLRRLSLCEDCESREKTERDAALGEFTSAVTALMAATDLPPTADQLSELKARTRLPDAQLERLVDESVRAQFEIILQDEYLTEEEEVLLDRAVKKLGVTDDRLVRLTAGLRGPFLVARTNAGRLPVAATSTILLKRGETAHLEVAAQLMKEVLHREMRGRSSGITFPIVKGVRFRTGAFRGNSVVVGTSLEIADTGTFTVTSRRAIFKGLRRTVEVPLTKLLGVNVFNDGIQLHASGRVSAPLFRLDDGYAVAAVVNAAWQKLP